MKADENFFERVYQVVSCIPPGRVTTYGAIARCLGTAGAARMVGWAMNAAHTQTTNVPAHRVINRNGLLTGKHHFGNHDTMRLLLESEGVRVVDDKVVDFDKRFWDPALELLP